MSDRPRKAPWVVGAALVVVVAVFPLGFGARKFIEWHADQKCQVHLEEVRRAIRSNYVTPWQMYASDTECNRLVREMSKTLSFSADA